MSHSRPRRNSLNTSPWRPLVYRLATEIQIDLHDFDSQISKQDKRKSKQKEERKGEEQQPLFVQFTKHDRQHASRSPNRAINDGGGDSGDRASGLTLHLTDLISIWTAQRTSKRDLKDQAAATGDTTVAPAAATSAKALAIDPNEDEDQYSVFVATLEEGFQKCGGSQHGIDEKAAIGGSEVCINGVHDSRRGHSGDAADDDAHGDGEGDLSPAFNLSITIPLPEPLGFLVWTFHMLRQDQAQAVGGSGTAASDTDAVITITSHILLPALRMIETQKTRETWLRREIKDRDRLVEKMVERMEGAGLDPQGLLSGSVDRRGRGRGRGRHVGVGGGNARFTLGPSREVGSEVQGEDAAAMRADEEEICGILDGLRDRETGEIVWQHRPRTKHGAIMGKESEDGREDVRKETQQKRQQQVSGRDRVMDETRTTAREGKRSGSAADTDFTSSTKSCREPANPGDDSGEPRTGIKDAELHKRRLNESEMLSGTGNEKRRKHEDRFQRLKNDSTLSPSANSTANNVTKSSRLSSSTDSATQSATESATESGPETTGSESESETKCKSKPNRHPSSSTATVATRKTVVGVIGGRNPQPQPSQTHDRPIDATASTSPTLPSSSATDTSPETKKQRQQDANNPLPSSKIRPKIGRLGAIGGKKVVGKSDLDEERKMAPGLVNDDDDDDGGMGVGRGASNIRPGQRVVGVEAEEGGRHSLEEERKTAVVASPPPPPQPPKAEMMTEADKADSKRQELKRQLDRGEAANNKKKKRKF